MDVLDGFDGFVRSASPGLVRLGWLLTGDEASARDLVQQALVKVWARWSKLESPDAAAPYTRRVLTSIFLTNRRRRWVREQPWAEPPELPAPEDETAEVELRLLVCQALGSLSARQRTVVVLRYFDDLTEVQTAAVLGCSPGAVKTHASRALRALRQSPQLGDLFEERTRP